jgi:hypothetical protein
VQETQGLQGGGCKGVVVQRQVRTENDSCGDSILEMSCLASGAFPGKQREKCEMAGPHSLISPQDVRELTLRRIGCVDYQATLLMRTPRKSLSSEDGDGTTRDGGAFRVLCTCYYADGKTRVV